VHKIFCPYKDSNYTKYTRFIFHCVRLLKSSRTKVLLQLKDDTSTVLNSTNASSVLRAFIKFCKSTRVMTCDHISTNITSLEHPVKQTFFWNFPIKHIISQRTGYLLFLCPSCGQNERCAVCIVFWYRGLGCLPAYWETRSALWSSSSLMHIEILLALRHRALGCYRGFLYFSL
jgi:hypothetical protein